MINIYDLTLLTAQFYKPSVWHKSWHGSSQFNAANSFFQGFRKWFWILNSKQWPIRKQMKEEDTTWNDSGVNVLWFYIVIYCRVYDRNQGSQHCEGYSLSNVGYFFLT